MPFLSIYFCFQRHLFASEAMLVFATNIAAVDLYLLYSPDKEPPNVAKSSSCITILENLVKMLESSTTQNAHFSAAILHSR